MTKADWLDFFEAINGRSATEEEIAAALAAGEFQDDAPAVETAPVQEAPAQPAFASAQETPAQEAQPQPTFAGAQEAQPQPTFASAQDAQPQAPFANAQASPTTTNLCRGSNSSSPRSAKSSSATTSWFCECSSWSTSSFC